MILDEICRDVNEAIDILSKLTVGQPSNDEVVRAIDDFAIPAMEKEIARDVVVEVGISRREYYACPNCTDFIKWRFDANRDNYEPGICPGCGQNLKWR